MNYGKDSYLFYGDSLGYYSYLPSTFCIHNLDSIERIPADMNIDANVQQYFDMYPRESVRSPKGHYINQYTCGVAIFELPFFIIAHTYVKLTGGIASGYSNPYHHWLKFCSIFYLFLGLLYLHKILKRYFSIELSLITISLLILGSNLFWFGIFQFGMAHNILFLLVAFLIDRTIKVHEDPSWKNFSLLAICLGFIALLRPTDVVVVLIPLLYNVYNIESARAKITFIKTHLAKVLGMIFFGLIPLLPQLIFWKVYAGSFVYYSYTSQGFDFLHPRIISGLFGSNNGWLLYSPIFILSMLGMFFFERLKKYWLAIAVLTPLYIYIIYSWHCFSYINGFGSRPMIHLYALLAIPMAALLQYLSLRKGRILIASAACLLFVYINLHFSYLNMTNRYWSESSTHNYYWHMFFKHNLSYNDLLLKDTGLEQPVEKDLQFVSTLAMDDTVDNKLLHNIYSDILQDTVIEVSRGTEMPSLGMQFYLNELQFSKDDYLKISTPLMFPYYLGDPYRSLIMVAEVKDPQVQHGWYGLNTFNKMTLSNNRHEAHDSIKMFRGATNQWDTVSIFIPLNEVTKEAWVKIYFWNISQEQFYTKGILLEHWKKK